MDNKIKNSENFLDKIVKKNNGFSTPKNYFNDHEERFSSFLIEEKISKKDVFATPENYFDTLEEEILTKVTKKEAPTTVISLKRKIYKVASIGIAASILLFLSINFYNNTSKTKISFDNLAKNDIENWFLETPYEITTEDIATIINANDLNTIDLAFTDIKSDAIEDYLIYNDDEIILTNEFN